jgi:hypothetical protein
VDGNWRFGRLGITAVRRDGRPFRQHRWKRRREFGELLSGIHRFATDDRQHRFEAFDLILGDRKVIGGKHGQVR